jgi:hypothetical protein
MYGTCRTPLDVNMQYVVLHEPAEPGLSRGSAHTRVLVIVEEVLADSAHC